MADTADTVGELIAFLSNYHKNTKVMGTWEGITTRIWPFYNSREDVVFLDVDEGWAAKMNEKKERENDKT